MRTTTTMDRNTPTTIEWTSPHPDNDMWVTEVHRTTTIGSRKVKIFPNSSIINTSLNKDKTLLREGIFSWLTNSTTTKAISTTDLPNL
jgi:hypothetical protein